MRREKILKSIGMALFTLSAFLFIGLSFLVDINFNDSSLSCLIDSKNKELANSISTLDPAPPVLMVSSLSNAFDEYAQNVVNQNGINKSSVAKIEQKLESDPSKYNETFIEENFDDEFVQERLKENTGWMIGRSWESYADFEKNLKEKVTEVNRSVVNEYGISSDQATYLLPQIMQEGSPEWLKTGLMAWFIFGLGVLGGFLYALPLAYKHKGIHNDHVFHNKSQTRHYPAIIVFICLVVFYIVLYQLPAYLANQVVLLKPLAEKLAGTASDRWFLYGFLYTIAMTTMGFKMMLKYRGNQYQQVRTLSVLFFQIAFAFTLPQILTSFQLPAYDFKSAWPLEYTFFFDYRVDQYLSEGTLGIFLFGWGIALFAIGVPLFTYFFGKRWYCSWVCGCGGLAETVGDPYRHLSDKRLGAWKIERVLVHSVLVFAVFMTVWVAYTTFSGTSVLLGINSYDVRSVYGFSIGFVFAGAVGTGFYPVMGNRVWCRFGCPLAAYLGLVQRFKSRFRITTNGGQCISCGNCSTYCEMGIDVRWYAQRGQNIVRSSCVGCGVCSAVCPRGVLKLENKDEEGRINDNPILIGREGVSLNL
ncbi:4Fe-4S binding protein [Cryomorphaceae bacterium 1068]|nr:4Fe-4S binding protein [Cryomorphaceae bacterium 1068]